MTQMRLDSSQTHQLLAQLGQGSPQALDQLLDRCRPALLQFAEFHLDPKMRPRLDPSDVVQEAQMTITRRIHDFLQRRPMSFQLWARKTVFERLLDMQRDHRRQRRSVEREVLLPDRSSLLLAQPLLANRPSP